ncbi:hypothetical protein [Halorubrum vacuolatum]|uniref:Uncharacterized protein n=1 Tax=Halorubrum vacuolatum TaxID=63740 RepID=A0A238Y0C0_HALVU|nr:hypothetical protein [Halorubrum vacuolatum]SNR63749.1 hypothetical protein SAMN06264855_12524 [Halorubrum vacuolatum]
MEGKLPSGPIGYGALALLGLSVAIHLTVGVSELLGVITGHGAFAYALMLLVAAALPIVLMGAMVAGVLQPNATYATLSGVFAFYLFAYVDIHALGTIESVTGADLHSHDHGDHGHDDGSHGDGHDDHGHDDGSHGDGHDDHGHDDGNHGDHHDDHAHDDHGHDHDDSHAHDDHGHSHEGSTVDVVAEHLIADPLALISKVAEGTAVVLFALLALRED